MNKAEQLRAEADSLKELIPATSVLRAKGCAAVMEQMAEALRPFADFQATGSFDGSVYEGKPDAYQVLICSRTGAAVTLGDFQSALAALRAFEGGENG